MDRERLHQTLRTALERASRLASRLLIPERCAACRALLLSGESLLCRCCRETLIELPQDRCPRCALPDTGGVLCPSCAADPPPFTRTHAGFVYGAAIADVIWRLKYRNAPQAARALAGLCLDAAREDLFWCGLIVPIPLHPSRLRRRGFNQSALLTRALIQELRPACRTAPFALRRIRATPAQVGQRGADRLMNVRGAFKADERWVLGSRVLLIDDVMTTGATAREAARAAMDAGAQEVRVFCAARACGGGNWALGRPEVAAPASGVDVDKPKDGS